MSENCLASQTDKPIVALLVDGENISSAFAGKMMVAAGKLGELQVRRVYGNAAMIKGWDTAPGIRLVHSGAGKNSADIVLALDAFQLSYESKIDVFALASSDGDFMHLAARLRERGFRVVGIGEKKAPECFRKSCNSWVTLAAAKAVAAAPKLYNDVTLSFDDEVLRIVRDHPQGITKSDINKNIRECGAGKISDQPQKTWASYFKARPNQYLVTGSGQEALYKLNKR
ncbi:NYN domain-containing protein [Aliiroseovarius sp. Z3]|uniref:NYN domain-containing protein n=1 Tax=Aliiroseovarius sp. Z3 TaxID=2811402 RepID=UPI0023B244D2|nr:NYN domain-containing protein [Aliiroseovarius sp. Z3]MDE9449298.1 NYN domain-containing protein [Aliiroseovarius sp. Z3]